MGNKIAMLKMRMIFNLMGCQIVLPRGLDDVLVVVGETISVYSPHSLPRPESVYQAELIRLAPLMAALLEEEANRQAAPRRNYHKRVVALVTEIKKHRPK